MDVFLEVDAARQTSQVSLQLDGVSTTGSYYYQSGNSSVMGFFLSHLTEEYDSTPLRLNLRVIKAKNTEFYDAVVYLREAFYYSYQGSINIETSPDAYYGGGGPKVAGAECFLWTSPQPPARYPGPTFASSE